MSPGIERSRLRSPRGNRGGEIAFVVVRIRSASRIDTTIPSRFSGALSRRNHACIGTLAAEFRPVLPDSSAETECCLLSTHLKSSLGWSAIGSSEKESRADRFGFGLNYRYNWPRS